MARKWSGRIVARALVLATLWLAVSGRPLVQQSQSVSDEGPLFLYGWGKITRLQYLYSAGPYVSNCFLRIRSDGSVDCEEDQNERNLLEFRAVALKTIAIKDVSSVRYLCMSADGKIYGLVSVPPRGGMLRAALGPYLFFFFFTSCSGPKGT
ncbi:fibroblast growth factor 15, isoform CRA_a [Rattus norvegicus]|uniref:Fibroblast growth factor 15, isoform CRA_a n=1 Tax=Rattus norvegicus TaxID=10116 RepID=A6HYH8_RAT|nr:fibroblast growth factor 15, isoform CRA_a [Rattus norvegicus]